MFITMIKRSKRDEKDFKMSESLYKEVEVLSNTDKMYRNG